MMRDFAQLLANCKNYSDPCAGGAGAVGARGFLAGDERRNGIWRDEKNKQTRKKGNDDGGAVHGWTF